MPLFLSNTTLFLYFLISLSLLFLSLVCVITKSKKLDSIIFIAIGVMMICFYGLRYPGNSDTRMYLQGFDSLSTMSDFLWSSGFFVLMKSIRIIGSSHETYLLVSSIYFVFLFMVIGCLYCHSGGYKSLFLISCFYSWSVLDLAINTYRQGIAVPFIVIGYFFFYKKRYLWAISSMAIALTLHWGSAVVVALCFVADYLRRHTRILKVFSIATFILFTLSFFINLTLASLLSKYSALNFLQMFFIDIDLVSKLNAYLGGGVVGARFYDMAPLQRLYFSGEMYISVIIFCIFYSRKIKNSSVASLNDFVCIYSLFISISFYGVILISMTWFIRNFYWAVPMTPVLYVLVLQYYEKENVRRQRLLLLVFGVFLTFFSIETFWRAPLMHMAYPS